MDSWTTGLCHFVKWRQSFKVCVCSWCSLSFLYKIKRKAFCESHINPSVYDLEWAIKWIVRFPWTQILEFLSRCCLACANSLKTEFMYGRGRGSGVWQNLTLRLRMSYIYICMELLVKPEMLTSYIYGPTFGNAETVSFYFLHNVSTLN